MGSFSRNVHKNKKRISNPVPNPDAGSNPIPRSKKKANLLLSSGETNLSNEQNKDQDKEGHSKNRNERTNNPNKQELKEDPGNEEHPRPYKQKKDDLDVDSGELTRKIEPGNKTTSNLRHPLRC